MRMSSLGIMTERFIYVPSFRMSLYSKFYKDKQSPDTEIMVSDMI